MSVSSLYLWSIKLSFSSAPLPSPACCSFHLSNIHFFIGCWQRDHKLSSLHPYLPLTSAHTHAHKSQASNLVTWVLPEFIRTTPCDDIWWEKRSNKLLTFLSWMVIEAITIKTMLQCFREIQSGKAISHWIKWMKKISHVLHVFHKHKLVTLNSFPVLCMTNVLKIQPFRVIYLTQSSHQKIQAWTETQVGNHSGTEWAS